MKRRLSFNKLLHNDKLMLIFSLFLGIFIWGSVVYGPSNVVSSTVSSVPVTVAITNPYAQENDLRVIGGGEYVAAVQVSGQRSVIDRLTAGEFTLSVDTSTITSPGTYVLPIKLARGSTNYDIVGITPSTVEFVCDYWRSSEWTVDVTHEGLSVPDAKSYRLGSASVSGSMVRDGKVILEGPLSQLELVDAVVACIEKEEVLNDVAVYTTQLKALDANGQDADISLCRYLGAESDTVSVTVPVEVYRRIDFTCDLANVPAGYDPGKLLTITPAHIEVWGPRIAVENFAASVTHLGTVDFSHLRPETLTRVIYLEVPDILTVSGNENLVTLKIGLSDLSTLNLSLPLTSDNVLFEGLPAGYTARLSTSQVNVILCGPAKTLKSIKADKLRLTVDLSGVTGEGQYTPNAIVSVKGQNTVWGYYGETSSGIPVGVTISTEE